jgi:diguanylate cyclase (GGDEF)-like protein
MKVYTRRDLEDLLARVKENEEIAQKFFEVEMSVLSTLNFNEFFEELLREIKEKFGVPYVWLSMIASSRATRLIHSFASNILDRHFRVVDKDLFANILGGSKSPVLCNEDLHRFKAMLPEKQGYVFNSIAIVPISLDGEPVGSLNFADITRQRFSPDIDTSLLEQLGVVVSISLSNVAAHEELRALAFKDSLTGLLNRRAMEKALKREFGRAKRYKTPLSLVFIDLDGFKLVNDRFGHDSGDDLLVFTASCLMELSRDSDIISRFAGDEFVLVLPETEHGAAALLMKRLQAYFQDNPLMIQGLPISVQFSFGIASASDEDIKDTAMLLKRADENLYKDKALNKAR